MNAQMQRFTVKCHGPNCETLVNTTISHRHDAICKQCARAKHRQSNNERRAKVRRGEYVAPHGRGRIASIDGNPFIDVTCKCHHKPIADCPNIKPETRKFEPPQIETWQPWKAQA